MKHSLIAFKKVNNSTVVTEQFNAKPLKVINPKSSPNTCFCVLTNYGGGFVQGDKIHLEIKCGEATNSVISSQANTRIYESNGQPCTQIINTKIGKNAFHTFINDPLVMHKGSSFQQKNTYYLQEGATLLLIEWFVAGRTENDEVFDFKNFISDTDIRIAEKPVVRDRFELSPQQMDIGSPGLMAENISFMNIYLVGAQDLEKVHLLEKILRDIHSSLDNTQEILGSTDRISPNSYLSRYCSASVPQLRKIQEKISGFLLDEQLLAFDPIGRR